MTNLWTQKHDFENRIPDIRLLPILGDLSSRLWNVEYINKFKCQDCCNIFLNKSRVISLKTKFLSLGMKKVG